MTQHNVDGEPPTSTSALPIVYQLGEYDSMGNSMDVAADLRVFSERSEAAFHWLEQQRPAVVKGMRVLQVRCPVKGCLLAEVYRFPLAAGGERFLARAITSRHTRVGFLNWTVGECEEPLLWYPAACRCGESKLSVGWLFDLVGLVRGWHHCLETVGQAHGRASLADQRGIARRTFLPEARAWRPRVGPASGTMTTTT